ncbi:DUF262 domain-containing protein [Comamonas terrigena]|uniref:DUF262 domain-containing protein n=1 Tax=Comamonas terrigena TaxID=32013 RepID=A0A2A7UUV4_COMTR|nr:DUF262 domain-containing protein [Comamonas terrigena]PEH89038.1 DUF262 domain-containing protein [Comamonas terrigena]SUY72268.1 Uncharacterized conserved protein [Comamonas terrigena]
MNEEIEGIAKDEDASWGDYPIDTVLIRNENRTVHDVLRRIEKGSFVMDPDFQRDFIWPIDKQSKLIESVLMRIPLPVFYLAENNRGQMIVVDGLQRLSTFQRFANNNFPLKLPDQIELHGKYFSDLSPKLQNRIEDCGLILYVIDAKVPAKALLDIFDRVNSGIPLTRQQMRNSLYTGPATKFLRDEAASELFKKATGGSLKHETMRDRELINRFCAFALYGYQYYKGDMDIFLAEALVYMNTMPEMHFARLSNAFRSSLRSSIFIFGKHAFRKHYSEDQARSVFNASLWDVMTTTFCRYPESVLEAHAEAIKDCFYELLLNSDFNDSITLGTNQPNRVLTRFAMFEAMLEEIIND